MMIVSPIDQFGQHLTGQSGSIPISFQRNIFSIVHRLFLFNHDETEICRCCLHKEKWSMKLLGAERDFAVNAEVN